NRPLRMTLFSRHQVNDPPDIRSRPVLIRQLRQGCLLLLSSLFVVLVLLSPAFSPSLFLHHIPFKSVTNNKLKALWNEMEREDCKDNSFLGRRLDIGRAGKTNKEKRQHITDMYCCKIFLNKETGQEPFKEQNRALLSVHYGKISIDWIPPPQFVPGYVLG
ncbi:hypothetical protein J6590_105477, partial [Homalodisca vitripennis]